MVRNAADSGTTLDAQARYAAGIKEILRRVFDGEQLNPTDVIVEVRPKQKAEPLAPMKGNMMPVDAQLLKGSSSLCWLCREGSLQHNMMPTQRSLVA